MNAAKTMLNISPKMSNRVVSDKKELEKYVKMFSTKAVQVIVQSRLGDKIQTFSNPRSLSNDWVRQEENYYFRFFFIILRLIAVFKLRHRWRRCASTSEKLITRIFSAVDGFKICRALRSNVLFGSWSFSLFSLHFIFLYFYITKFRRLRLRRRMFWWR